MICLWTSPEIADPAYYHHDFLVRLSETFLARPRLDYRSTRGCHLLMVLARWLFDNTTWFNSLRGPRIIIEHDAYLNFIPESPYYRAWEKLYQKTKFDLILSSGKVTTSRLRDAGLPAVWVPKGTEARFLEIPNDGTAVGHFARPIAEQETGREFYFYRSRREMSRIAARVSEPIACPYSEFVGTMTRFAVAITDDRTMMEPMAKTFECSALGCLVIRDRQEELLDLGFRDRESIVFYEDVDEIPSLVRSLTPDFVAQARHGARRVASEHTWGHRAKQVRDIIRKYALIY